MISALQVVTIKTNIQNIRKLKDDSDVHEMGTFSNFSRTMSDSYVENGLITDANDFRVNSFVEGFHDALILFALAVDAAIQQVSFSSFNPQPKHSN